MAVGITIAALAVLFGASGSKGTTHFLVESEKKIKNAIDDKTRRKAVLDELDKLSESLQELEKKIERHMKDYVRIHSDYQSSEADYDAVTGLLEADQQEAGKVIMDARENMRERMTKDEWCTVFDGL